jgi:hypothetical protein
VEKTPGVQLGVLALLARGNVFTNTKGATTAKGTGLSPPYELKAEATANLEATLRSQVGPRR